MSISEYASTDRQREVLDAVEEHGSQRSAAAALGVHPSVVDRIMAGVRMRAAKAGHLPDHSIGSPVPEGHKLSGVSTLFDSDGQERMRWVKTTKDQAKIDAYYRGICESLGNDIKPLPAQPRKTHEGPTERLSVYPVTDLHIGADSSAGETGEEWGVDEAYVAFSRMLYELTAGAQSGSQALLVLMGDLLHADNEAAVTPAHGNPLDVVGSYEDAAGMACDLIAQSVQRLARKHKFVDVMVLPGNHDPIGMMMLKAAMRAFLANQNGVNVLDFDGVFGYYPYKNVLLGFHHGHTAKPADLPLIMSSDCSHDWARASDRCWFVGHKHTRFYQDFPGCRVEGLRSAAAADAYAHRRGWRPHRELVRIDFDDSREIRRDRAVV